MIELIHHPDVGKWVVDAIDGRSMADVGEYEALGVIVDGEATGGVIYSGYDTCSKSINAWIRGTPGKPWLKRAVVRRMFEIPFIDMKCEAVRCGIKEGNKASEKLCRHLGFRKEGILRRGWDGRTNMLIFGMLKSECKWIKEVPNG